MNENKYVDSVESIVEEVKGGMETEQPAEDVVLCTNCGAPLSEDQAFCPKCGTPKKKKPVCGKCGAELAEDQAFCPKCGQKVGVVVDAGVASKIDQFNAGVEKKKGKKKKIIPIIAAAVAVVAILVVVFVVRPGASFNFMKEYGQYADEDWCQIASDGSYMKLDTNPSDADSDDVWEYYDAYIAVDALIDEINDDLGFGSSVHEKMNSTTALQGRQSESNDKFEVSWTYHPDHGLEVMYEVK